MIDECLVQCLCKFSVKQVHSLSSDHMPTSLAAQLMDAPRLNGPLYRPTFRFQRTAFTQPIKASSHKSAKTHVYNVLVTRDLDL